MDNFVVDWRKRIGIGFGLYCVVVVLAYCLFLILNWETVSGENINFIQGLLFVIAFKSLAILLVYHRPENRISWLLALMAWMRGADMLSDAAEVLLARGAELSLGLLFANNLWALISGLTFGILAYLFVLFPGGHLPSARWRPATWLLAIQAILAAGTVVTLAIESARAFAQAAGNTISVEPVMTPFGSALSILHVKPVPWLTRAISIEVTIAVILVLFGFLAQVTGYRRGSSLERQQIRWVLFVMAFWFLILVLVALPFGPSFSELRLIEILLPSAIAVPILRYRLYDIDLIIRRTLVYGLLTGLLAVIYFGSVAALQSLFSAVSGQDSPVIIVLSTLFIAAIFAPLRRRVQDFIDRRFFRQKYNAERTLTGFATTVRDEVDLNRLTSELVRVVQQTMEPESVSLWMKDKE